MRVLVVGGLTKKGISFISRLKEEDYVVILDNLYGNEAFANFMKLFMKRKVRLYQTGKESLEKIKKEERIEKVYDFT